MDFRLMTKDDNFCSKIKNFDNLSEEEIKNIYINLCAMRKLLEINNKELKKSRKKINIRSAMSTYMKKMYRCDTCNICIRLRNLSRHIKTIKHIQNYITL